MSKQLQKLAQEFQTLCENEDFEFCNDQDDFLEWLAERIEKAESEAALKTFDARQSEGKNQLIKNPDFKTWEKEGF